MASGSLPVGAQDRRKEAFRNRDCVPSELAEVVVDVHLSLEVVAPSLSSLPSYQMEFGACNHGLSEWSWAPSLEAEGSKVAPGFNLFRDF